MHYFLTLTIDPSKLSAGEDATIHLQKAFAKFRTYLRREFGTTPTYIKVVEFTKRGLPHYHILIDRRIDQKWISRTWDRLGGGRIVWIERARINKVSRYLSKYLTKEQEGISEPMDFLPPQVYKKLTREKLAKLRFSIKDFQHYYRVEAWKPYFERLLADRRAKKNLVEAGYHERAIRAALKTRAATPAACEWLASHRFGDAPTIRNAHSRISRKYQTSQN